MKRTLKRILNLGAGVQSSTVLLMSCLGQLPKLDLAVFADTGWEPKAVYRHLWWLAEYAADCGIPVHLVSAGNIKTDALTAQVRGVKTDGVRWASMPYHTRDRESGELGMIRRQCTSDYKIQPIERFIRQEVLDLAPRQRAPREAVVEQWFGISYDELYRMRRPSAKWTQFSYPLIDARMSRAGCMEWLESHGFPAAPRSACIGCPFKSNYEWRRLRDESPDEWQDAIEFDQSIRNCGGMRGQVFLHRDCVPLGEADLRSKIERDAQGGQGILFDGMRDECQGMCGV